MVVTIVSSRVDGNCVEWMWVEGLLGLDYSNSSDVLSLLILNFNMSLIWGLCNSTKNLSKFQRAYYLSCKYQDFLRQYLHRLLRALGRILEPSVISGPTFGFFLVYGRITSQGESLVLVIHRTEGRKSQSLQPLSLSEYQYIILTL